MCMSNDVMEDVRAIISMIILCSLFTLILALGLIKQCLFIVLLSLVITMPPI